MSIITRGFPGTFRSHGRDVQVETGFRFWLEACEAMGDAELDAAERAACVCGLLGIDPADFDADGVAEFMACGRKLKGGGKNAYDFAYDAAEIVASFQMQYGIDLTDPRTDMHWWRFRALLSGLCDDTPLMRLARLRTADPPEGKGRDAFLRARRDAALPTRSLRDSIGKDKEIWGDASWQTEQSPIA